MYFTVPVIKLQSRASEMNNIFQLQFSIQSTDVEWRILHRYIQINKIMRHIV